jgi:hypothetical protein
MWFKLLAAFACMIIGVVYAGFSFTWLMCWWLVGIYGFASSFRTDWDRL